MRRVMIMCKNSNVVKVLRGVIGGAMMLGGTIVMGLAIKHELDEIEKLNDMIVEETERLKEGL